MPKLFLEQFGRKIFNINGFFYKNKKMHFLKRTLCFIGNYLPPKINSIFYRLAGVKFNFKKVWIGNKCYLDKNYPENIIIENDVCISAQVSIFTHFDSSRIKKIIQ